ncbi:hypothetical protein SARC_07397 [Sphaeroforma arctica JP610]|uniref:Major facilitator superfamily (MFS) profile domain-containing protein n=1 Tax=Sphaeroforma arctica JP610 TaxID=667725 RepID=A0A0L0FUA2_9EUKA|nr:hypothetical protein SARC_07397 [Sphaeroforma arctica JP610]KNC80244.1 hypothetical protein SARC_07397 [Sphaeroforma arctica JP610]|eukprot:XP_014154146.1 hypothetical protein SARC_07397 [Sphaeroforma arctica JP610]
MTRYTPLPTEEDFRLLRNSSIPGEEIEMSLEKDKEKGGFESQQDPDIVFTRKISQLWEHPIINDNVPAANDVKAWVRWTLAWLIPGLGMFMESYMIFSTGQIKTIWGEAYPTCWSPDEEPVCIDAVQCPNLFPGTENVTPDASYCTADGSYPDDVLCDAGVLNSVSFTEFAGVIVGMLLLSMFADRMGRRAGSLATLVLMTIAGLFMTMSLPVNGLQSIFLWFAIAYFVFGFGVGGEYPVSASSAAERSQANATSVSRGKDVGLTFSCQGIGAFAGSCVIVLLLVIVGENSPDCLADDANAMGHSQKNLEIVWRVTYGLGVVIAAAVAIYRYFRLKESTVWQDAKDRRNIKFLEGKYKIDLNNPIAQYKVAFTHYWSRIIATAGCWCLWDVAFYGNKLFSGPIFAQLVPDGSLITVNLYICLNNFVALIGYYVAASLIDRPWCGRRRLQLFGFTMMCILFAVCAALFDSLDANVLLFLYICTSFFGQCGPNMTTYVTPTEVYPVALRATCHGLSSMCGMTGALTATIVFGYLDTDIIFAVCSVVSFISLFFTYIFMPNVTEMHLVENDRYLEMILTGRADEYHGEVRNPKFCSNFERWTGFCETYNPNFLTEFQSKLEKELLENEVETPDTYTVKESSNAVDNSSSKLA